MSPKTRLRSLSLLIGPIALCGALVPGSSTDARADEPATAAARAVRSLSGAADPAIWRDPADSARSTLIGQRDGSVGVYDLPGNPIQSLRQASLQVDLRDGFVLDGQDETIAALSGGPLQALRFFRIDRASRGLVSLETWSAPPAAVSGSCLYVSPITHETFVFALSPTGTVTQLRVEAVQGRLELLSLRRFEAGEKATVCAADDEMSVVYVAAGKRILRFDAEASVSANFDQAAARSLTSSKSVLGLALYRASDGTGYLLVSQGTDEIAVYRREGDNEPVTTLRIAPDGSGRGELAITGIDVTSASLGSALPKGALVAQDRDQLRILAWDQLASSARPRLKIDAGASAAQGLARASTLPLANRAEQGQTTAADQNQEPNTFKLSEPSGLSTSFSTDGLSEQVDDFNGILFLSYDIPGVGPLRYGSRLDGVFTQQGAPLVSVKNVAGFGLGWELHFGRFLDYSSASGGFRNEFAFEYPNGTRTRQVCDGDPCAYTKMQDGGTIKALGAQYNDGIYQAVSVTTPDGVTYRLDYHVPMLLEAKAWLGVPNTWFGGPDGWYPTRVEDRYGNFTEIAYHGQSATSAWDRTPIPRRVRRGRRTPLGDVVTQVAYFYLEADTALDREPADRAGLRTDARVGAIRFAGPNSSSATALSATSQWQTIQLSYESHFLKEIAWKGTQQRFRFEHYDFTTATEAAGARIRKITYPSGGEAEYEYAPFQTLNASAADMYRYPQSSGVRRRSVSDKVSPGKQFWDFYMGFDRDATGAELAKTWVWYHSEDDPGYRVETWYEPIRSMWEPLSHKTGRLRRRQIFVPADATEPIREEQAYTAVFRYGYARGPNGENYRAFPGARAVFVSKSDGSQRVGYLELFRDPTRRSIAKQTRMPANGYTDYDVFGNPPFLEVHGDVTSVQFSYDDPGCFRLDLSGCKQDTVTFQGGSASSYSKLTHRYAVDTDPRAAQYEAANLVRLVSRDETHDIDGKLVAASETYYDNDPRRPVEGITPGIGDRSGTILGRPTVAVQVNVDDAAQSPVTSTVYAIVAGADQPGGAALEEAVKVGTGEYRRTRRSFERGGSCASPVKPTETSFVTASGSRVTLSRSEYNCAGVPRWTEDENGQRTSFVYDSFGRLLKEIQPGDTAARPTTEYVYDDSGQSQGWKPRRKETRTTSDDVAYNSTFSFYDGLGRVFHTQYRQASGKDAGKVVATSTRLFREGLRVAEQTRPYVHAGTSDPAVYAPPAFTGPRTVTVRDGLGRVLSVQEKNGATILRRTDHQYGDTTSGLTPLQEAVIDPNARRTVTTYDTLGRTTLVHLPDGNQVRYEYDKAGRLQRTIHPDGRATTQTYDGLWRVASTTTPGIATVSTEYDLTGAVVKERTNGVVSKTYDERGRIQSEDLELIPGRLKAAMARYVYDAYPANTGVVNQAYAKGRLTQVLFGNRSLGNSYSYGYDAKGRVIEQVTKFLDLDAKKTETAYDRQGLVRRTVYQAGESDELDLGFTYDQNMRTRQVVDRGAATPCGGGNRVLTSYTYDLAGKVLREEWLPCSGSRLQGIDFSRDEFGRLLRINDPSLVQSADPGNDANDLFGLALGYEQVFSGSTPQRNGNVSWTQWRTLGGNLEAAYVFSYDERDQLRKANFLEKLPRAWHDSPDGRYDVDYTYDSIGNIKTLQRRDGVGVLTGLTYSYDPANGRRLQSLTGSINASFRYDGAGNLTSNGRWPAPNGLFYDYRNLLTSVTVSNQYQLAFLYDASGVRVRKGVLLYDPEEDGFVQRDVFHHLPQAVYKNKQLLYWELGGRGRIVPPGSAFGKPGVALYMKDHLGSVRATLHEDGMILETTDYYPSGMEMQRSRKFVTQELPQFTGQLRDREFPTTVDYFKARYYDPELGRFFSADALRDQHPDFSPYAYVLNNPLRFTDPSGNDEKEEAEEERKEEERRRIEAEARLKEQAAHALAGLGFKTAVAESTLPHDPGPVQAPVELSLSATVLGTSVSLPGLRVKPGQSTALVGISLKATMLLARGKPGEGSFTVSGKTPVANLGAFAKVGTSGSLAVGVSVGLSIDPLGSLMPLKLSADEGTGTPRLSTPQLWNADNPGYLRQQFSQRYYTVVKNGRIEVLPVPEIKWPQQQ